MSLDTKPRVIPAEPSTSPTSIKTDLNNVTDQDISCSGCLISHVCTYLRGTDFSRSYWVCSSSKNLCSHCGSLITDAYVFQALAIATETP